MFTIDVGIPDNQANVFEYTDIPFKIDLKSYHYYFEEWKNDSRFVYSHIIVKDIITELNQLIDTQIPPYFFLFVGHYSHVIIILMYFGILISISLLENRFVAFLFACVLLVAFSHSLICATYQYFKTKSIIDVVQKRLHVINKTCFEKEFYFKLINVGEESKCLNVLLKILGHSTYSLRLVYFYIRLI